MKIAKYFWDLNAEALRETSRALKDPSDPLFSQRMVTFLERNDKPKELFAVLPKGKFIEAWPMIRAYWIRRARQSEQRAWWETIYERLVEGGGKKRVAGLGEPSILFQKFGGTIKEARIKKGLSQKELALRTGLKQPLISQVEDGKKNMTLLTLMRLCKVLDIQTIGIG